MRLTPQTLSAVGDSPWMIPGPMLLSAAVALALSFTSNANLTAEVQYTYDDPAQTPLAVTFTRSGTTLTVNYPAHGLNAGDTVDLSSAAGIGGITSTNNTQTNLDVAAITDQNNFTVAVANAGITADTGFARIYKLFLHPTLQGLSGTPPTKTDGFFNEPVAAFRLKLTSWTAGSATLTAQQTKGY